MDKPNTDYRFSISFFIEDRTFSDSDKILFQIKNEIVNLLSIFCLSTFSLNFIIFTRIYNFSINIHIYKQDLPLNSRQGLICRKTPTNYLTNQHQSNKYLQMIIPTCLKLYDFPPKSFCGIK